MKTNWHVQATRLAARKPYMPWGKVCAEVASRRSTRPKPPTQAEFVAKMEQMKLF